MNGVPTALGGAVVGTFRRAGLTATLAFVGLAAACGGSETAITSVADAVASLTITAGTPNSGVPPTQSGPLAMEVGDSLALSATATNALGLAVFGVSAAWSSSAPTVVQVGADGVAKALTAGAADVYAAASGASATVRVVVSDTTTVPPPAP